MSNNDVDITIRGKNLSREAFAEVSKSIAAVEKGSAAAGATGARSFRQFEGSLRKFDDVLQLAGGPNLGGLIQGVGQLDEAANSGAGSLGKLAKAGLVASAALGGWQIGRKIAELTGSDTLIGNMTAKILGWGDASREAASAGADVLARASKNAGREITDMAEALRINEEAARKVIDTNARMSASATGATLVAGWRKEIADLRSSGQLEGLRKDLASQNFSQQELADRYRLTSGAMQLFNREVGEQRKAVDKANTANDQYADKIKKIGEGFRGVDAVQAAMDAIKALHVEESKGFSISDMTRGRAEALNKVILEAIEVNRRAGKSVPEEWQRIARETTFASQQGIADITELIQAVSQLQQITLQTPAIPIPTIGVTKGLPGGILPGVNVGNFIAPDGPNMFERMFGTSTQFGAAMSQTILGALQGGGNPVSAATGMVGAKVGTDIAARLAKDGPKMFQGALGGIFSSALPVVGSLLGPLTSALWNKLFGSAGRDAVKDFAGKFGGFDALQKEMLTLGDDYDRLWRKLTQQTGKNDKAGAAAVIEEITAALDAQKKKQAEVGEAATAAAAAQTSALDAITAKYAESISRLDSEYKSLSDSVAKEADEEIRGITETLQRERMAQIEAEKAALEAQRDAELDAKRQTFDAILTDAERVNVELREMFGKPMEIPYYFRAGNAPDFGGDVPGHSGGAYIRQDHVARVHAGEIIGPADFMTRALTQALQVTGGGFGEIHPAPVILNNRKVGEIVFRQMPRAARRFGKVHA